VLLDQEIGRRRRKNSRRWRRRKLGDWFILVLSISIRSNMANPNGGVR
jgi:hypothetical protein